MKYFKFSLLLVGLLFIQCAKNVEKSAYDLVNPFIGTGGHGHTFPGATLPFGMVQLSPDTRLTGWDGCSGYHNTDSIIFGFSHTHLSGTGISDYGDVLLMPFNAEGSISLEAIEKQELIPSVFKKENEFASPGYYKVHLDASDTDVELTSTLRSGIHKYNFNKKSNNKMLIDLNHRDMLIDVALNVESATSISGYRHSKEWAQNQSLYFYMEFSVPFEALLPSNDSENKSQNLYRILNFSENTTEVLVKVGVSAVSVENAKLNLQTEAGHWDFSKYLAEAKKTWTKELNKIEVTDDREEKMTVFYSALYHTMIAPNTFSDVNGDYRGMDRNIHNDSEMPTYTVFSLWDTFRAAHPLYTIIDQKRTGHYLNTFLKHYDQGGRLPVWELCGNETECMIGYHSVSVITDAYVKGITNFDSKKAFEAMVHGANLDHFGLESYKRYDYIRASDESESVSKTLEYAYDDWCIGLFAKLHNNEEVYTEFMNRAQSYKNIFDPQTQFMRARLNGGWFKPFDPSEVNFNYTEANSWQYSLFAPHDIAGLVDLFGGETNFEQRLDDMFNTNSETTGRHQADITGLIGQYAHGNEPSHHMAYLYNFIGKPWKTQERVKQIIDEQYWNGPDGLSGNEDCGQMSAWYVLSSSGFYSVTPGMDYYVIGAPAFKEVQYNLENGNTFKIVTHNLSDENKYIGSASLNGKPYDKSFLKHEDLMNGGILKFEMSATPSPTFGIELENRPLSQINVDPIVTVPFIDANKKTFTESLTITVGGNNKGYNYKYTLNPDAENPTWINYMGPFDISESSKIQAVSVHPNGDTSKPVSSEFLKIKAGRSITINAEYANQYAAEGDGALIDMLKGSNNFRTGFWQGYQGQDVEVVVNLGKKERINRISTGFLQDNRSWIWYPAWVSYEISEDGVNFKPLETIQNEFPIEPEGSFTQEFELRTNTSAQYVRMKAKNFGKCPPWHLGAGGDTWIFIDEIVIE